MALKIWHHRMALKKMASSNGPEKDGIIECLWGTRRWAENAPASQYG